MSEWLYPLILAPYTYFVLVHSQLGSCHIFSTLETSNLQLQIERIWFFFDISKNIFNYILMLLCRYTNIE